MGKVDVIVLQKADACLSDIENGEIKTGFCNQNPAKFCENELECSS
jgi:hypothetical protein